MNEEILINHYWTSLKQAEEDIRVLSEMGQEATAEMNLIYGIAAAGVLRHGTKFQVVMPNAEDTQKQKKLGFFAITSDTGEPEVLPANIEFRDPEGDKHSCGEELLRKIMHEEYDRVILKIEEEKPEPAKLSITLPDIKEEEEELLPETEDKVTPEDAETMDEIPETVQDASRLPVFFKDGNYKDDAEGKKPDETFLYNQHDVTISYGGESGIIHFFVFPLAVKFNERATDIVVIAESGEVCRAGVSHGIGSSVELEFAEIPFVVRGSFEQGEFRSQVNSLNDEVAKTMQTELKPHPAARRTSTTYVQMRFMGIDLNVFPAKFKNNGSTGYAPGAIAIERNGLIELLTPTSEGPFVITGNDGENISVETYWVGSDHPEFRVVASEE
ncbi:MAG: hypothetical protein LUE86_06940 [Clostridiales bacterium]|nr:hypothetical protein [Clostridiales bacterium]